jgi:protein TonB
MFSGLEGVQPHPARRWTALVSFPCQAALVGAVLVFPLLKPASLPEACARRPIFRPISAGVEHPQISSNSTHHVGPSQAPVFPIVVHTGHAIHFGKSRSEASSVDGPPQITGPDDPNAVIARLLNTENARPVPHPAPSPVHRAAPMSVIMEGNLVHRVEPRYPVIAQQVGIEGTVVIKALISRSGNIEHAAAESGQPLLVAAALAAVREWKYKPYYLNGEPVEVETEITVKFLLNR